MHDEMIMVLRLLLAGVLGGLIGFQRERAGRAAGLRTLSLIAIGAALFTSLALFGFDVTNSQLAANVVVGVGFLGAGTIIHREQGVIEGMTTAATIWVAAAVGVAAGTGKYFVAIVATGIILIVLLLPHIYPRQGSDKT
jgi:putative Mg2+ transporter-C (MgtC) family protein